MIRAAPAASLPENPVLRAQFAARLLRELHPGLAEWLAQGVQAHIERGIELGAALGFSGKLGRTPRFKVLCAMRNALLRDALRELDGSLPALVRAVRTYEGSVGASDRRRAQPPAHWTNDRKLIHQAAQIGMGLPATDLGLRKAVDTTELGDVEFCEAA